MAEKAPEQKPAGTGEKQAKHSNMPLMAIIGIVLVLNLLIVGKVFIGSKSGPPASSSGGGHGEAEVGKKLALSEEFLVNLAGNTENYLKASVTIGLRKDVDEKKMEEELPVIKDTIISILSSRTRDQVSTEEGKQKLKDEIKERVNKELHDDKVAKIYFTAFATQ